MRGIDERDERGEITWLVGWSVGWLSWLACLVSLINESARGDRAVENLHRRWEMEVLGGPSSTFDAICGVIDCRDASRGSRIREVFFHVVISGSANRRLGILSFRLHTFSRARVFFQFCTLSTNAFSPCSERK